MDSENDAPVDCLYRWIDPVEGAAKLSNALVAGSKPALGSTNCLNRYRDNGELKYSLRSVIRHAQWFRKIHIVGEGRRPIWLGHDDRIHWIDLKSFMTENSRDVPLNSETQKLYFTKIEALSDKFICFDDDWFLGSDIQETDFFTAEGMPIQPSTNKGFGGHAPLAWTKALYDRGIELLPHDFVDSVRSGGAHRKDPTLKMRRLLLEAGLIRVSEERDARIWLRDVNVETCEDVLRTVLDERPAAYCINDDWSIEQNVYEKQMIVLQTFFRRMYPTAAPWEANLHETGG